MGDQGLIPFPFCSRNSFFSKNRSPLSLGSGSFLERSIVEKNGNGRELYSCLVNLCGLGRTSKYPVTGRVRTVTRHPQDHFENPPSQKRVLHASSKRPDIQTENPEEPMPNSGPNGSGPNMDCWLKENMRKNHAFVAWNLGCSRGALKASIWFRPLAKMKYIQ